MLFRACSFKISFPDSSVHKESACNAGDPGSIPVSGRSTGEGIGYPLQYSWASLVAQLVKNLPTMWETWVQSLGWEDPLEKEKATYSSTGLENSMDCIVCGVPKSWTRLSDFHFHFLLYVYIYHLFFICSSVDGHLHCFDILAIVNVAMNISVHVTFQISVFVFFG